MSYTFNPFDQASEQDIGFDRSEHELERDMAKAKKKTHDLRLEDLVKELPRPPRLSDRRSFPSRAKYVCCASYKQMPFPFSVAVVLAAVGLIWATVSVPIVGAELASAPMWVWGAFVATTVLNWAGFLFVGEALVAVTTARNYMALTVYYYSRNMGYRLGMMAASIVQLAVNHFFYTGPASSEVITGVNRITGVLIAVTVAGVLTSLCAKYTLSHIDVNSFWYELAVLFWKRKTMRVLLTALRRHVKDSHQVSVHVELMGNGPGFADDSQGIQYLARNASFIDNTELFYYGEYDRFTRYLMRGLSMRLEVVGLSADEIIVAGSEVARYDFNLVRLSVRTTLLLYHRLGLDLTRSLTINDLGLLPISVGERSDLFRLLSNDSKAEALDFGTVVDSVLEVMRDQERLDERLSGSSLGGSVMQTLWGILWYGIAVFVAFGIFSIEFSALITPAVSFVLGFSFIFGESVKRLWHAFIEIVVIRRFRAGDWVEFEQYSDFEVDSVSLYAISGMAGDGQRIIVPSWRLWDLQLKNYNQSGFFRTRFYVRVDKTVSSALLSEIADDLLHWVQKRSSTYSPSSFSIWEVADYLGDHELGWSQLIDLRSKTLCMQVSMPKLKHSDWSATRAAQTAFQEAVKKIFHKREVPYFGLKDVYSENGKPVFRGYRQFKKDEKKEKKKKEKKKKRKESKKTKRKKEKKKKKKKKKEKKDEDSKDGSLSWVSDSDWGASEEAVRLGKSIKTHSDGRTRQKEMRDSDEEEEDVPLDYEEEPESEAISSDEMEEVPFHNGKQS